MLIGSRLRDARKRFNYSQEQLAKLIGVSKGAISLYENEKRNQNMDTILEIMYALGVSSDYLLGADVIVEIESDEIQKFGAFTKEEFLFINELRKDKIHYETLFSDYKRGLEIIKRL